MRGLIGILETCWVTIEGLIGDGGLGHLEEGFYLILFASRETKIMCFNDV